MDFEGPVVTEEDSQVAQHVEVPDTHCPNDLAILSQLDPLQESQSMGVDIYSQAVSLLGA